MRPGFAASGKKKKRKTSETGEKRKKKRKLDIEEATILRETSVDRSARETEELYLKLEKSNRALWLQSSVLSLKEDAGKTENRVDAVANSDPIDAVEGEDVAHSKLEGGVAQIDHTDNNEVKVMSDTPVPGDIAADSKLSPDLCGGTTEASDREEGVFLSEGRGVIKLVRNNTEHVIAVLHAFLVLDFKRSRVMNYVSLPLVPFPLIFQGRPRTCQT